MMATTLKEFRRIRGARTVWDDDALQDRIGKLETHAGSAIKSLGGIKVGGYLCVWGSPSQVDRSKMRDFFTPACNFGRFGRGPVDTMIHHGLMEDVGDVVIGEATMKADTHGLAITAKLDDSIPIARKALNEIKTCPGYGWSSGTCAHLNRRTPMKNAAGETVHRIDTWKIIEASLTATPAEPRALASFPPAGKTRDAMIREDPALAAVFKTMDRIEAERRREDAALYAESRKHLDRWQAEERAKNAKVMADAQATLRRFGVIPKLTKRRVTK